MENILLRSFRTFNFHRAAFSASFIALLVLAGSLGMAGSANAQWTPVTVSPSTTPMSFGSEVHCVRFLDNLNPSLPLIGFAGCVDTIWRTGDGGVTWAVATVPSPQLMNAWINDITFSNDGKTGFAIVQGNTVPSGASGILMTTDAGITWTFDLAAGTPDSGCGIYFNNKNGRLFASGLDKGLVVSQDNGSTWNVILDSLYYTGFAFIDDTKGVLATQGSNIFNEVHPWLRTLDGGLTWSVTRTYTQSWQPVGISTTSTYFASCANWQGTGCPDQILRSDDNGNGFQPVSGCNGPTDSLTESMAGDGCTLFATSSNLGMLYSVNDGVTWLGSIMAPNPPPDTRFWVTSAKMWSFQADSVYSNQRPATADIHVWPQILRFIGAGCFAVDSTIHIFGCNCAKSPILAFDTIHTTSVDNTATFMPASSATSPLNVSLCNGTTGFGSGSLNVTYKPSTAASDSADYFLVFHEGASTIVDTVQVSGGGVTPSWTQVPPAGNKDLVIISEPACVPFDTCTCEVINTSCSAIKLIEIDTSGGGGCEIEAEFPNDPVFVPILPGGSFCLPIHFNGGLQKKTFNLDVTLKGLSGTDTVRADFVISATVTTNVAPLLEGFKLDFKSCCDAPDTEYIYLNNTTCDTLTLADVSGGKAIDIKPTGSSLSSCFSLDSVSEGDPLHHISFPHKVGPTDVVALKLRLEHPCVAGTCSALVTFNGFVGTPGGELCNSIAQIDSVTVPISVKFDAGPLTSPVASGTKFNFGSVSCCDTTQTRTIILTGSCVAFHYDSAATVFNSSAGHFEILHQPHDSEVFNPPAGAFKPATVDSIVVRFIPPDCNTAASAENGGLSVRWFEDPAVAQTFSMTGASSLSVAVSQSNDSANFDSVKFCSGPFFDTLPVKNTSCTPGMVFVAPQNSNSAFTVMSPSQGDKIGDGATIPFIVSLNPATAGATGAISGNVVLTFTDQTGKGQFLDTLYTSAYIEPPVPGYVNTSLDVDTLCDSGTVTETFTVTNTGECYTYDITGANAGSGVTATPQGATFPVHIAPNATQTFSVTFIAGTTDLTGNITLADSGNNPITETYDIPVRSCTKSGTFTLTMKPTDSTIVTPNCTVGQLTFSVGAGGGAGNVTSVSVTGSSRFSTPNPTSGPMPFTGTVNFDPNVNDLNSASLTINYTINGTPGSVTIPLTGIVTGSKYSARIGITSPTAGCIAANGSDQKEFDVVLRDTIQDSLGVTQLSFLIRYDGNLLWNPTTPQLAPGWSIASEIFDNLGIHVTLKYTPTGSGNVPAGTTIFSVTQYGALSDSIATTAFIDSTHFNDSAYEACTMKALSSTGEQVPVCIDTACNTNIMLMALQGNLSAINGIAIIPNPAHKNGIAATLNFTTNLDGIVNADVLDILGNPVLSLSSSSLAKGDHSLPIPTQNISEGAYFVRIQMGAYTMVKKFVLQKD